MISDDDSNPSWNPWKSPKNLEKTMGELEISGRRGATQTTAMLKSARILRRVLEIWVAVTLTPVKNYPLELVRKFLGKKRKKKEQQ